MKIQKTNNTFQFFYEKKEDIVESMQKKYDFVKLRQESVQIDISEEGLENYRKSVQNALEGYGGQEESYKEWQTVSCVR